MERKAVNASARTVKWNGRRSGRSLGPLNRSPGTPSIYGADRSGFNQTGRDLVSGFRSVHSGGAHFVMCDGSVRFVREGIDAPTYRGLSTYAAGEVISGGW